MKTKLFCSLGMTLAAVLAIAGPAHADLVNVDFDHQNSGGGISPTYAGTGAAGGGFWNGITVPYNEPSVTSVSGSAPKNSLGNVLPTAVTVSVTGISWSNDVGGNSLMGDYIQLPNPTPATITIGGLTAGGSYDLWLYGTLGTITGYGTKFTFNATDKATADSGYGFDATNVPAGDEGKSFVKYAGLVANGSGQIIGTVVENNGNDFGAFNGFQIANAVAAPEPSSILLIILGLVGCTRFCSRKRARS